MGAAGDVFVTPHAVRRFRERIAPLPENQALAAIIHSFKDVKSVKPSQNGKGLNVRTSSPWKLRALVMPPTEHGGLPSVVTVLPG